MTASVWAGAGFFRDRLFACSSIPLSREVNQKIANELAERRKGFAPGTAVTRVSA